MLLVTTNPYDYHFCSQGETKVNSINDGEELGLTDVRSTHKNRHTHKVFSGDSFIVCCSMPWTHWASLQRRSMAATRLSVPSCILETWSSRRSRERSRLRLMAQRVRVSESDDNHDVLLFKEALIKDFQQEENKMGQVLLKWDLTPNKDKEGQI